MGIASYAESVRDSITQTPNVLFHSLAYEDRPPIAGLVKGTVTFADGSRLYFKEFVRLGDQVVRLKYAYHYVSPTNDLVFRYDNALDPAASHVPSWPDHKHVPGSIEPSSQPLLSQVLREATQLVKRS